MGNSGRHLAESKAPLVELGDLMLKLEQMDKKLKCSLEDRQEIRKELRHNKNENLDNYFTLARATEDNLQQMAERVETTDKERKKNFRKDMEETKRRYESVNDKLWNLETRLDTISRDQAESSCVIQSKQDAFLSNSIAQEKTVSDETEKQPGPKVDFVEPQRKKQESTPLPQIHNSNSIGSVMTKTATKRGLSNSSRIPRGSGTHTSGTSDVMTWASTWEMMNRTLEAFATRNTESSNRGGGKMRKTFKKPKDLKNDSDGCTDTWVEVMRLYLEQNNLNDERQVCTAILSNLEGTALKSVVVKKEAERDTADKILEIFLNRFESGMKGHQAMARFEEKRQRDDESVDRFLNDLEILRIRSDPEESNNRRNFNIALKFIDRVKGDDLRKMSWTYNTSSKDNAPTPEEMTQTSREYILMKPIEILIFNQQRGSQKQRSTWYKPRDDMESKGRVRIVDPRAIT